MDIGTERYFAEQRRKREKLTDATLAAFDYAVDNNYIYCCEHCDNYIFDRLACYDHFHSIHKPKYEAGEIRFVEKGDLTERDFVKTEALLDSGNRRTIGLTYVDVHPVTFRDEEKDTYTIVCKSCNAIYDLKDNGQIDAGEYIGD